MIKTLMLSALTVLTIQAKEILQDRVEKELNYIKHPNRTWLEKSYTDTQEPILDVAIIGGGQTGLTMAFSMMLHNIDNIKVYDENKENASGAWINFARMKTLRTPKSTTGPDLGIPVLSVQCWYEANFGVKKWENLKYIPRLVWHDYLNWYRKVLNLPVSFESNVGAIEWDEINHCFKLPILRQGKLVHEYAKKIIYATGLQGSGEWMIPDFVRENVKEEYYAQAICNIPKEKLKNKRIAILGAGPNAFDLTLFSAKAGAKSITLFSKREKLVNLHCFKWGEFTGFMKCFTDLTDEEKYRFAARMHEMGQPPVGKCVKEAYELNNFSIEFSSPWENAYQNGDEVIVQTKNGEYSFDYLILATGWVCDLTKRKELKNFVSNIALWADKYTPENNRKYEKLLKFPYLGRGFQFTEKLQGKTPYINSIFNMTGGGLISNGFCAGTGLTGMKYSIDLITHEIVSQFFVKNADKFYASFDNYDKEDFPN